MLENTISFNRLLVLLGVYAQNEQKYAYTQNCSDIIPPNCVTTVCAKVKYFFNVIDKSSVKFLILLDEKDFSGRIMRCSS